MRLPRSYLFILFRFGAEFAARASTFITFPLLTTYLGTEGYGVQTQITTINNILVPVATLGLGFSVVRVVAGNTDAAYTSARFASTLLLSVGVSLALAAAVILAAPLLNALFVKVAWATTVIRWSALLIVVAAVERLLTDYYRARLRIMAYSVFQVAQTAAYVGGVVLVFSAGGGLLEVVQAMLLVKGATILLMALYFWRAGEIRLRTRLMPRAELAAMVQFGIPIVVMGISTWMLSLGDRTVIGYFMSASEVGVYGAAYTLAGLIGVLAMPFWGPLYPLMATYKNNGDVGGLAAVCRRYTSAYLLVGIPALFGLTILSSDLLRILGTAAFAVHPLLFGLIIVGLFSDQFAATTHYLVYLHNEPKFLRNITVLAGALNIGLNVALVPALGIWGAALTTCVTYVLLDVLLFRRVAAYGYHLTNLYDLRATGKYLLSAAAMSVIVGVAHSQGADDLPHLLALVALGAACYGIVLFTVNGFSIRRVLAHA